MVVVIVCDHQQVYWRQLSHAQSGSRMPTREPADRFGKDRVNEHPAATNLQQHRRMADPGGLRSRLRGVNRTQIGRNAMSWGAVGRTGAATQATVNQQPSPGGQARRAPVIRIEILKPHALATCPPGPKSSTRGADKMAVSNLQYSVPGLDVSLIVRHDHHGGLILSL